MYRLNAPPASAMSATNRVLANDLVFDVGQAPGEALAATPLAEAGALFTLVLLCELHAAVKASSPITRIMDNFRTIRFPPGWPLIRISKVELTPTPPGIPVPDPPTHTTS